MKTVELYNLIEESIKQSPPDAVLLSGGIDSSIIAYFASKYNRNVTFITVVTEGTESPDLAYAKQLAAYLGVKRHICVPILLSEIDSLVYETALSLSNFNIYWVSAALVLLKGIKIAKLENLFTIATGEGSDDLFGSFPVMLNWNKSEQELIDFINIRVLDIDLMTEKVAKNYGVEILLPYHNENVKSFALKLPLSDRIKLDLQGKKISKSFLRETFKNYLPSEIIYRPQTMAFTGASTLDTLVNKYSSFEYISDVPIKFNSGFEKYLFSILHKNGRYSPDKKSNSKCIHCFSTMRSIDSVHCITCGTLQYKQEIIPF